ncbi:Glycerol-3-phosphate dehydrogenase,NAD-dependent [Moorella glycerini]|uniref:Glycerol-3-phosphate dehydrogenase [NAD(P)+] n=1 Tax=Neomoorella stamsii TaxID=1266720 RepID=A0A9X7J311_9FIRM|nr:MULTISPECIES: NAD(P)H-dependent glycerol-3-phosphate dehydrogenase [Moorella]PRR73021.1 Glycerol-3-phosphate dehydrogenase [Moorella stamsii]CEP67692.1 Glycerol-3-phosphate dehydrogenase,NAD-dependent [Moorella glycerini]
MTGTIAVIGAGSWGTALAVLLARKGLQVNLWARRRELVVELEELRENKVYLPGVKLPVGIRPTTDLELTTREAGLVVLSVPSHAVRLTARQVKPFLPPGIIVVNTAKGLELDTKKRLSEVLTEEGLAQVAVLSGPSHAEEVGRGLPTTVVVAAANRQIAEYVQDIFMDPTFRVYTNPDVAGVEFGGALKNIIALATGIADGLGLGDNARAALMTRGMAEIARLGVALGGKAMTFAGLSGIGDLIVTCTSMYSRNRRAGMQLGEGKALAEILSGMGMVVEGVRTTAAARDLARQHQIRMPITEEIYKVLYEGKPVRECVAALMERPRTHEVETSIW